MEKTFIMVKPDGVKRGLIGEIVKRFENKGFNIVEGKLMTLTLKQAEEHYKEHKEKTFFNELIEFITSGKVFAMVWEGENIVQISRLMIGKTKITESLPGTIRGDYAFHPIENIVHGSDSPENAEREIKNIFG